MVDKYKIPSDAPKIIISVACTQYKNKTTDFFAKYHNNEIIIGARREGKILVSSNGSADQGDETSTGKFILINDVKFECIHCSNRVFLCECGVRSCYDDGKSHTCPNCKDVTGEFEDRTQATVNSGVKRLLGNAKLLLEKK